MESNFLATKSLFNIPNDLIYLDGNSLGPPTKTTSKNVTALIDKKWGKLLINGWNTDKWIDKPTNVGNRIAKLIGAEKNTVILGDTLSIKTYQALYAAIKLNPKGKVILSDSGNFPSDIYIAQGLIDSLNLNYKIRIVEPNEISNAITDEIAILFLTEIDYRTARKHDITNLTKKAQEVGAITIWDLAHSAGVLPLTLEKSKVDFAVGCTYKYLNGGPGSPAYLYVAPKHHDTIENSIKGWLGHKAPFSFTKSYEAASGINKMQIGTPSIIATAALESSLDILEKVDMQSVRSESMRLTQYFINQIHNSCPDLKLVSPLNPNKRGAHLAFTFKEGYAVIQCLIEHGVIGDFRMPDLMRFGFNPIFINQNDVFKASQILTDIMKNEKWNRPDLKVKSYVT